MEEVVLKYSPNILKGKKASFILHHSDDEDLSTFRNGSGKIAKNTLFVREQKPRLHKHEYYINPAEWTKNEPKYEELTRGCFVVLDYIDESESDFLYRMERYNKYYPVVFVSFYHVRDNPQKIEYLSADIQGWKKRTSKNQGVTLYVNKSLSNFEDFTVNFENLFKEDNVMAALVSTREIIDEKGNTLVEEIFGEKKEDKKPKPVTIRKDGKRKEADWSLFEGLPQPSMSPDHSSETWIGELYLFLRAIMIRIVPKGQEKLVDILVNKTTIKEYWLDIFTSEFNNPNTGENYETYEAVGDSVIKYVFYIYLYEKFGTAISKNQLNDLKTKHLSTSWQQILGKKMELDQWILIPKELAKNAKVREDLTEAFAGGVEIILNKYARRGLGQIVLLNMVNCLFHDYDFDLGEKMQKDLLPLETKLIQWYSGIGGSGEKMEKERITIKKPRSVQQKDWDIIREDFEKILKKKGILIPITENNGNREEGVVFKVEQHDNKTHTVNVHLNDAGYKALERNGLNPPKNKFLAKATGKDASLVDKNAKVRAMEKLEEIGLTDEWRDKRRIEKNQKRVEGVDQALIKARSENRNIVEVVPKEVKRTTEFIVYQLYGIMNDGRTTVLETVVHDIKLKSSGTQMNGFQDVVDKYLSEELE